MESKIEVKSSVANCLVIASTTQTQTEQDDKQAVTQVRQRYQQ